MTSPALERTAGAWDGAGVRWALLRGKAGLGGAGSDADLLVHRDDLLTFEALVLHHGGCGYPRWAHPWHRRFRLGGVELDVVTELRYRRHRQVASGLEDGCLARRVHDGWLWELCPTDLFWTVLLHCLLDKKRVSDRRATELWDSLLYIQRPSAAEAFTARLLPPGWSVDRLIAFVEAERWDDLERLAERLTPRSRGRASWERATGFSRSAAAQVVMRAAGVTAHASQSSRRSA
jgi:hypothetical protein